MLSVFGIILALVSISLTYATFFHPLLLLRIALMRPDHWYKVPTNEQNNDFYRHRVLSGFSVTIDWDRPVVENFWESWLDDLFVFDCDHNKSVYVLVSFNGIPATTELFVTLDGFRYFVPVPRAKSSTGYCFRYDWMQRQLARAVGRLYLETWDDFFSRVEGSFRIERLNSIGTQDIGSEIERLLARIKDFKAKKLG